MRLTAPSRSIFRGGFRAGLILSAFLIAFLLGGARASGAAVGVEVFPVAAAQENETSAAVSGDVAVWEVSRSGTGLDVQGKNLATGQNLSLPAEPGGQRRPSVDGRIVVWEDTSSGNSDIYGYDLSLKRKFPVAVGPGDQEYPSVEGSRVVWEDDRGDGSDVYGYDLDAGREIHISTAPGNQRRPVVGGATVVWEDHDAIDSDVVARNLATGEETTIAGGPTWQDSPAIGENTILWREESLFGNYDVYGYDLAGEQDLGVIGGGAGDQLDPATDGRVATWTDDPGGSTDIRGKDLSSGEAFAVAGGQGQQENPATGGGAVVWEVQREGDIGFGTFDVLGATLDLAPEVPKGLTAQGSAAGVELDWDRSPEDDLAGYNVYRAGSEDGSYTRLNTNGPLSASFFSDPNAPEGSRSFYKVTALDNRGSESGAARANAMAPRETGISLSVSPAQIDFTGGTATLSGQLTSGTAALPGRAVVMERRPEGQTSWSRVAGGATTDSNGRFSLSVPGVDRDTEYRAVFEGAEDALPSTSETAAVDVRTTISVSTARTVKLGRVANISGVVLPNRTGEVSLTIKRGGVTVARQTAQVRSNSYLTTYRPTAVGSYEVVASFGIGPDDANTTKTAGFAVKRLIRR